MMMKLKLRIVKIKNNNMEVIACVDENQVAVGDDCSENYENLVTIGGYYGGHHL